MIKKTRGTLKPHNSSIVLNLKPVMAARNVIHPIAFLMKIGITSVMAVKMMKGKSVQMNYL